MFYTDGKWKEHDTDRQAAKFRCAPTFVVPGTQKGASTFLFHALSRHPQVVPPLRGAHGYKVCTNTDTCILYTSNLAPSSPHRLFLPDELVVP